MEFFDLNKLEFIMFPYCENVDVTIETCFKVLNSGDLVGDKILRVSLSFILKLFW